MPKPILIGGSSFGEMVREGALFIDKSELVATILADPNKAIVVNRPRCWGKTFNWSLMHHFLAWEVNGIPTKGLFDKLVIAKIPGDYIAKYYGGPHCQYQNFIEMRYNSPAVYLN